MTDLKTLVTQRMAELGDPSPFTLAREYGLERSFINDILIGKKKRVLDITRLADALKVEAGPLSEGKLVPVLDDEPDAGTVPLVGYVGAGEEAHFYALSHGELDRVPSPEGSTQDTVAVEIRGDSLGSLFQRWLVFYDEIRSPITTDLIGRLCVVGLPNDKVLVKQVRVSKKGQGLYDLYSNTEAPIKDVPVQWAARVKSMVPR